MGVAAVKEAVATSVSNGRPRSVKTVFTAREKGLERIRDINYRIESLKGSILMLLEQKKELVEHKRIKFKQMDEITERIKIEANSAMAETMKHDMWSVRGEYLSLKKRIGGIMRQIDALEAEIEAIRADKNTIKEIINDPDKLLDASVTVDWPAFGRPASVL